MYSSPVPILGDSQIPEAISMSEAIEQMEYAFDLQAAGKLVAPARLSAEMDQAHLMFTCGEMLTETPEYGFRVYNWKALKSARYAEMTPVFSAVDGELQGIILGTFFGAWRTGAIGGVALKSMANPDSRVLALIGTGLQARTQLLAACTVLDLDEVRIYSRSSERCQAFVKQRGLELAESTDSPPLLKMAESVEAAVADADVVITATTSEAPLLRPEWLSAGVHLQNVGPKFKTSHEIPLEVVENCSLLATDALLQAETYGEEFLLPAALRNERLKSLPEIYSTQRQISKSESSWFCSLGLAGTEIVLANFLFNKIKNVSD